MSETAWNDGERRNPARPPARRALRLTFRFDGEQVELAGVEPLRKLVPPSLGPEPEEGRHAGEWLQLRGANDQVLFTRVLNDPLGTRVEVHDPVKGPSIVVGPPSSGTFDVVVPDLPETVSAVLFMSRHRDRGDLGPAVLRARYDLPRRSEAGPS